MTDSTRKSLVYLDTNPFIYLIEGEPDLVSVLERLFQLLQARPGLGATSELTLAEVLPKAHESKQQDYLDLIVESEMFHLVPVTRHILIETAEFRRNLASKGTRMPKLPDAIHAVTAAASGCRFFLSSDGRLPVPDSIRKVVVDANGVSTLLEHLG